MRRTTPLVIVLVGLLCTGCLGSPSATPATDTDGGSPTATTTVNSSPPGETVSVTYNIETGNLPSGLTSATATVEVVFAERQTDLGPCWAAVFRGPYQPTITPIGTPAGDCRRGASTTVALAAEGVRSLNASVPGSFDAGHAFVVTDVRATTANGSTTTDIRSTGGQEVHVVEGSPDGPYHVELALEPAPENANYEYALVSTVSAAT